jgi:hypothetical protein
MQSGIPWIIIEFTAYDYGLFVSDRLYTEDVINLMIKKIHQLLNRRH